MIDQCDRSVGGGGEGFSVTGLGGGDMQRGGFIGAWVGLHKTS